MLKPLSCTLAAIAKRTSGNKRMHLMNEKDESKSNAGMQERKNARHGDDDVIVSFCPSKCINKIWWWWVHTRHTDNFWITVNNSESIFSVPHKHIWRRRRWKKRSCKDFTRSVHNCLMTSLPEMEGGPHLIKSRASNRPDFPLFWQTERRLPQPTHIFNGKWFNSRS